MSPIAAVVIDRAQSNWRLRFKQAVKLLLLREVQREDCM
jgi:hypothetical protein